MRLTLWWIVLIVTPCFPAAQTLLTLTVVPSLNHSAWFWFWLYSGISHLFISEFSDTLADGLLFNSTCFAPNIYLMGPIYMVWGEHQGLKEIMFSEWDQTLYSTVFLQLFSTPRLSFAKVLFFVVEILVWVLRRISWNLTLSDKGSRNLSQLGSCSCSCLPEPFKTGLSSKRFDVNKLFDIYLKKTYFCIVLKG